LHRSGIFAEEFLSYWLKLEVDGRYLFHLFNQDTILTGSHRGLRPEGNGRKAGDGRSGSGCDKVIDI
jgi:hypothetical protein